MKLSLVFATLLFAARASEAGIIAVGGSGNILTAGLGVGYTADFFGDPTLIVHGWDEVQNFTLPSNLSVDITTTGNFIAAGSLTPGIIPAGTVVNSHSFYYDPAGGGSTSAGFQFDGPILGVIVTDGIFPDLLFSSDFLIPGSVPATNIPPSHFDARGLEIGINTDHLIVGVSSVTLFFSAGSPGDQMRVITASVPEPAAGTFLVLSVLACAVRRRRRLIP